MAPAPGRGARAGAVRHSLGCFRTGTAQPSSQPLAVRRLTRDDAIRLATENNRSWPSPGSNRWPSDARVAAAQAAFVPTLTSSLLRNSDTSPAPTCLPGTRRRRPGSGPAAPALTQLLPWGGGPRTMCRSLRRANDDNNPIRQLHAVADVGVAGGFLAAAAAEFQDRRRRGRNWKSVQRNRTIADLQVRERAAQVLGDAEAAYWLLVAARPRSTCSSDRWTWRSSWNGRIARASMSGSRRRSISSARGPRSPSGART